MIFKFFATDTWFGAVRDELVFNQKQVEPDTISICIVSFSLQSNKLDIINNIPFKTMRGCEENKNIKPIGFIQ